ncbi:MAG: hypothetical protein JOZ45_03075 [Acidobacteriaceae bacterium]|nr:hypothetical protein [Acidobacteriaceae bacterium]MBV9940185.1 hypothetical protein [Acidobacteriaceae bacterium]
MDAPHHASTRQAAIVLGAIALTAALFKLTFAPPLSAGPYTLRMSPIIHANVAAALSGHWTALLLPFAYEGSRNFWATTAIFPMYFSENILGPYGSYIFWSTLFLVVSFICAYICVNSLTFVATLTFMFAFGTQLHYVYTYGNLVALYLVLTYIAVNLTVAYLFLVGRIHGVGAVAAFAITLAVTALSNEMWINYATALLAGGLFACLWAHRHALPMMRARSLALFCATFFVLVAYLAIRLRLVSEYLHPGSEEELVITYRHKMLLIDDLIVNFFTLLYMVIDNYFPSFVSSSNSLTYLGTDTILAEQNGFEPAFQNLIIMNHLFLWRFYAGVMVAAFIAFAAFVGWRAWREPSRRSAALAGLCLMIMAGFSTHLSIKMRYYNSVPALPYKVIISVSLFTILIAYLLAACSNHFHSRRVYRATVAAVWACVLLAALTRPAMYDRLLAQVHLEGFSDPMGQIMQFLR